MNSTALVPLDITPEHRVHFRDLGRMAFKETWDLQESIFQPRVQEKLEARQKGLPIPSPQHHLYFVEHNHVYTLGKSGQLNHLLLNNSQLKEVGAEFFPINRGGDITYHGPGQVVGYPIFDLDFFFTDIHQYMRFLEEAIIRTLKEYGIEAGRLAGLTGVWLEPEIAYKARKIAALGVKCSRWVTMHGFAFNVNVDLNYFSNIIPCGITDKPVTSMQKELGHAVDMEEVKLKLKHHIQHLFGIEWIQD